MIPFTMLFLPMIQTGFVSKGSQEPRSMLTYQHKTEYHKFFQPIHLF